MQTLIPQVAKEGKYTVNLNILINKSSLSKSLAMFIEECVGAGIIQVDITKINEEVEPTPQMEILPVSKNKAGRPAKKK